MMKLFGRGILLAMFFVLVLTWNCTAGLIYSHTEFKHIALFYKVMVPQQPPRPPPARLYKVGGSSGSQDKEHAHDAEEVREPEAELEGEWEDSPKDQSWCWEDWSEDNKKDDDWSSWDVKNEEEKEYDHGWWQQVKKEDGHDWWQQAKQEDDDEASDGICRKPAPWAANKGHVANNARAQRVPGHAWITAAGEKVWTHADTGVTYASH